MTDIRRPLSLQLNSSSSLYAPSSHSHSSAVDSPSLILPYLYVGDQDQTQIDTISSLNISYILSLQSLPKFLDSNEPNSDNHQDSAPVACPSVEVETQNNEIGTKDLLPSMNSSKDYVIKIKSEDEDDLSLKHAIRKVETIGDPDRPTESVKFSEKTVQNNVDNQEDHQFSRDGDNNKLESQNNLLKYPTSSSSCLLGRCGKRISSSVHRLIKGKCINMSDTFEQLVDKFFDETHNFIEEARRNRCNILVHCKAGISRSPTIAIAYLMKWKRLHLQEAYNFVKRCRPQISPNLNFMGQLMSYERQLQICNMSRIVGEVDALDHDSRDSIR